MKRKTYSIGERVSAGLLVLVMLTGIMGQWTWPGAAATGTPGTNPPAAPTNSTPATLPPVTTPPATTPPATTPPAPPATYSISGTVTTGSSTNLENVTVTATLTSDSTSTTTKTDVAGTYTIQNLSAGEYTLSAELTGYDAPASKTVTIADKNLTAQDFTMAPTEYTLTFNANGGTGGVTSKTAVVGTQISGLLTSAEGDVPTKTGHTFAGWADDKGAALATDLKMTASGLTVYAQWTVNQYTLTVNANDGTTSQETKLQVDYGTLISSAPTKPTREGYGFKEWSEDKEGTSPIGTKTMPASDLTVYAQWTVNQYTLTFNANDGTANPETTQQVDYGKAISGVLTNPTREGHTFVEWTEDQAGTTKITNQTMTASGFTVYAQWTVNQYTLTFNVNGGMAGSVAEKQVDYGTPVADALTTAAGELPTKVGHTFARWTTDPAGETAITNQTMPASGFTVYAQWTVNEYTLTLAANTGTEGTPSVKVLYGGSIADALKATTLVLPTKEHYNFMGWKADALGTTEITNQTMDENGLKVYASWQLSEKLYEIAGTKGENGWYISDKVTITPKAPATHLSTDGGTAWVTELVLSAQGDNAANFKLGISTDSGVTVTDESIGNTLTIQIDSTKPTLTATGVDAALPYAKSRDITLNVTAVGVSGVSGYEVSTDGTNWTAPTLNNMVYTVNANATYSFRMTTVAGIQTAVTSVKISHIDDKAPTVSVTATAGGNAYTEGAWSGQDITFIPVSTNAESNAPDKAGNTAKIEYSTDGGTIWTLWDAAAPLVHNTDTELTGTTYLWRATSQSGVSSTGTTSFNVKLDKSVPTDLAITYGKSPVNKVLEGISFGLYKAPVEVTLSAKDALSRDVTFKITGIDETGGTIKDDNPTMLNPQTGVYSTTFKISPQYKGQIKFTATDAVGNTAEKLDMVDTTKLGIIVETVPPAVKFEYQYEKDGEPVTVSNTDKKDPTIDTTKLYAHAPMTVNLTVTDDYLETMNNGLASTVEDKTSASGPYLLVEYKANAATNDFTTKATVYSTAAKLTATQWTASLTFGGNAADTPEVAATKFTEQGIYRITLAVDDEVGNQTTLTSALIYYDTTAPTINETKALPGWQAGDFEIGGTLLDDVTPTVQGAISGLESMWYSVTDKEAFTVPANKKDCTEMTPEQANLTAGKFSFMTDTATEADSYYHIWSYDKAGNQSLITTKHVQVDKVDPTISATVDPAKWTNGDVKVAVTKNDTGSGVATVTYSGNGKTGNAISGFTVKGQQDAVYTITVEDHVGNTASTTVTVKIDTTAPKLKVDAPGGWSNTSVPITITASDEGGSGFKTFYSQTDDLAKATELTGNTINADNNATYYVWAVDNAGNVTRGSGSVNIDSNSPKFGAPVKSPASLWSNGPVTLTITASDSGGSGLGKVNYRGTGAGKSDGPALRGAGNYTATFTEEQESTYTFNTSDGAGNSANSAKIDVKIDTTAPKGSITVGNLGTWEELLTGISFGKWTPSKQTITIASSDPVGKNGITSGVDKVDYWLYEGDESLLVQSDDAKTNLERLEKAAGEQWKTYERPFSVEVDRQFVVYARISDRAGNLTYRSSEGIIVDTKRPTVEDSTLPTVTLQVPTKPTQLDVYGSDVRVECTVADPVIGGVYSGLRSVDYVILRDGEVYSKGNLYTYNSSGKNAKKNLVQALGPDLMHLTIPVAIDSNKVAVEVTAVDNAGNVTRTISQPLKLDNTAPIVSVAFDGQVQAEKYFAKGRTAVITVQELNFAPENMELAITGPGAAEPWTHSADGLTHTQLVRFPQDGDYSFALSFTDMGGHRVENGNVAYSGAATAAFTVDLTRPTATVSFRRVDGRGVDRGGYSNSAITATITVREHNFNPDAVRTGIRVTRDGGGMSVPLSWGVTGDTHVATITFREAALYTFNLRFTDLAANEAAPLQEERFYIDLEAPVIAIQGIRNQSANNTKEKIAPVITVTDKYFSAGEDGAIAIQLVGARYGAQTLSLKPTSIQGQTAVYALPDLERDDLYTLSVVAKDRAGNESKTATVQTVDGTEQPLEKAVFSVNRHGSVYSLNQAVKAMVSRYYLSKPQKVVVTETNTDRMDHVKVMLSKDLTDIRELKEGVDYQVEAKTVYGGWSQNVYTINEENFASDGAYTISLYSKDSAGNESTNTRAADAEVSFFMDLTPPDVTVYDLEAGGIYSQDVKAVPLVINDLTLNEARVELNGTVIKTWTKEDMKGNQLQASVDIPSSNAAQTLSVICVDAAGNENVADTRTVAGIYVTTNLWVQFYANKPLFYGSITAAVLALGGLVTFLTLRKRSHPGDTPPEK